MRKSFIEDDMFLISKNYHEFVEALIKLAANCDPVTLKLLIDKHQSIFESIIEENE